MDDDWTTWDTLARRVKGRRGMLGLTQTQLADAAEMNQGDISKIERGDIQQTTKLPQLARALNCDPWWLAKGEGSLPLGPGVSGRAAAPPGLPVVGTAKLGDDGLFYELEHPVGHGDGRIDWPSRDPNAYAVRCKGDSMKPRIRHGEFVVVEPNHAVAPGDEVLVKARDGRVMVKELVYIRDGMVVLDSVNEAHPKISIPQEDVEVLHYVAGIAKNALWRSEEEQAPEMVAAPAPARASNGITLEWLEEQSRPKRVAAKPARKRA